MTIGLYKITHVDSGRFYIGSSKNCERRLYHHRWTLDNETHHNRHLQHIWTKHGSHAFTLQIIEVCESHDAALDAEQALIDAHYGEPLFLNASRKARMPILSPEVQQRAREAQRSSEKYRAIRSRVCVERNKSPDFQEKARAGILNSEKFKAARKEGVRVLHRPDVVERNRESLRNSEKQKAAARVTALRNMASGKMEPKRIAVIGTSISTGEVVRFFSQSAAAEKVGVYPSSISAACAGKIRSVRGYEWRKETV